MKKALACCGNLTFIDEEQQTIHFTHRSVKQFLLSRPVKESLEHYYIDKEEADIHAGATCVTYLNFPVFSTQVARTNRKSITTTGITSMVVKNSLPPVTSAKKIAHRLLRHRDKSSKSVHRLLEEAKGDTEVYRHQSVLRQYSFRPYAEQYWLDHTKREISSSSKKLWRLWCNLVEEADWRDTLSGVSWTFEDWKKRSAGVLQWIVQQGHCSLAQLMLSSEERLKQESLEFLVQGAALRGSLQLLEISLGSEAISQHTLNLSLQSAVERGDLVIIERLFQENVDIHTATNLGETLLHLAAREGYSAVVERLLQEKADIYTTNKHGETALHLAVERGYLDTVKRLRAAGAKR